MAKASRRVFLQQAVWTSAGCIAGFAGLAGCGTAKPAMAVEEDDQMLRLPLAEAEGKTSFTVRTRRFSEPLLLARQEEGTWLAIRLYCPHKGCTVVQREERLVCPCHGSQFTMTGQLLKGPAKQPLTTLPVTVAGKHLVVKFP